MSEDLHPPAENRKMCHGFLVLGFILIMALCSDAQPQAQPIDCCFEFFQGKIPPQKVLSAIPTDTRCSHQGFIVTTPKHRKLCVRKLATE
ncbi:C-C motif chemokine 14-like [Neoarius graeffei]|uniref:C-C motif chemokine 14-like n=1 Tax=Neoarius graeffei TaxID=443677 RepID=UPI00298C1E8A|nr:C-C motif chemokine 14-like [Neoarius graeffei]